jgi:AraC family ethanolamine operon transcriptional activator
MDTEFCWSIPGHLRAQWQVLVFEGRFRDHARLELSAVIVRTIDGALYGPGKDCRSIAKRRLLPLNGNFKYAQAALQLEHLQLVVAQRPPCASEGYLEQDQTGIALSMADSPGLKLDGIELDQPALVTHGLTVSHRIFQPSELTIAAVFMPDARDDRGWPERTHAAQVNSIQPGALLQLRSIFLDIVRLAVQDPSRFAQHSVVSGMEQSLLGTIDHAFLSGSRAEAAGLAIRKYVRVCCLAHEFIRSNSRRLPDSTEIAAAAGVTIRTLHNAMIAVHGMSLRRFLILHRLWAARAALSNGRTNERVKTVAFDHGFWHLGRFSRIYQSFFGESPSKKNRASEIGMTTAFGSSDRSCGLKLSRCRPSLRWGRPIDHLGNHAFLRIFSPSAVGRALTSRIENLLTKSCAAAAFCRRAIVTASRVRAPTAARRRSRLRAMPPSSGPSQALKPTIRIFSESGYRFSLPLGEILRPQ